MRLDAFARALDSAAHLSYTRAVHGTRRHVLSESQTMAEASEFKERLHKGYAQSMEVTARRWPTRRASTSTSASSTPSPTAG